MRKRLRVVADETLAGRVVFFRQQADVVAEAQQPLKQLSCVSHSPGQRIRVSQPEGACQKRALGARQSVVTGRGIVATEESIDEQSPLDRFDRPAHARV